MKKPFLALILMFLATLACSTYFDPTLPNVPKTATEQPIAVPTPVSKGWQYYTPVGTVNIHNCPDLSCNVVGHLENGVPVLAKCDGDWCEVANHGWAVSWCLGIGEKPCQSK